jgi:tetratricopeptide (TPR) repeat protein
MSFVEDARRLYIQAIFTGDRSALFDASRSLDGARAELAVARGMIKHGRHLLRDAEEDAESAEDRGELQDFEEALRLYVEQGNVAGEAEASFWIGCYHQVIRRNDADAVPMLERSLELATQAGDKTVASEALRHLGIAEHRAGRLDEAREQLEASIALREELGDEQGVAANLVGLIYIGTAQGRTADALDAARKARELASRSGATQITRQIDEACEQLPVTE